MPNETPQTTPAQYPYSPSRQSAILADCHASTWICVGLAKAASDFLEAEKIEDVRNYLRLLRVELSALKLLLNQL